MGQSHFVPDQAAHDLRRAVGDLALVTDRDDRDPRAEMHPPRLLDGAAHPTVDDVHRPAVVGLQKRLKKSRAAHDADDVPPRPGGPGARERTHVDPDVDDGLPGRRLLHKRDDAALHDAWHTLAGPGRRTRVHRADDRAVGATHGLPGVADEKTVVDHATEPAKATGRLPLLPRHLKDLVRVVHSPEDRVDTARVGRR